MTNYSPGWQAAWAEGMKLIQAAPNDRARADAAWDFFNKNQDDVVKMFTALGMDRVKNIDMRAQRAHPRELVLASPGLDSVDVESMLVSMAMLNQYGVSDPTIIFEKADNFAPKVCGCGGNTKTDFNPNRH